MGRRMLTSAVLLVLATMPASSLTSPAVAQAVDARDAFWKSKGYSLFWRGTPSTADIGTDVKAHFREAWRADSRSFFTYGLDRSAGSLAIARAPDGSPSLEGLIKRGAYRLGHINGNQFGPKGPEKQIVASLEFYNPTLGGQKPNFRSGTYIGFGVWGSADNVTSEERTAVRAVLDVLGICQHVHDAGIPDAPAHRIDLVLQTDDGLQVGGGLSDGPRMASDIDVFVRDRDVGSVLSAFRASGFETMVVSPNWLAKGFKDGVLVDVISRSTHDITLTDEIFEHAIDADVHGRRLPCVAPEDLIVMKAVAMTEDTGRYWYDALSLLGRPDLDWAYLARRAKQHGAKRLLALLFFAQSMDLLVPDGIVEDLLDAVRTVVSPTGE
jgi:hypothetical protein